MTTSLIVDRVRSAAATNASLRVEGAATWLSAGRPVAARDSVSLADDRGIVEYIPGDLTLTARAGTRLSEIHAATLAHGQWLPLDPWGGADGTLGATISTATAGPHSHAMGLPRDVVLGLEFVTGKGDTVRSGGRVVKNVAGFDLTRLLTGSWGTLGIITEATVRLRARSEVTRSVTISAGASAARVGELSASLRALPFTPLAAELLNGSLAMKLGLAAEAMLLVQIGGNPRSVSSQLDRLREMGVVRDVADSIWLALRTADADAQGTWRWSRSPSEFAESWTRASRATDALESTLLHGSPARGVVRVAAGRRHGVGEIVRAVTSQVGRLVIEMLPGEAWPMIPAAKPDEAISRAVRRKFDPNGVLNPGIMSSSP